MTRIELAPEIIEDVDHILDHLDKFDVPDPATRFEQIVRVISVLEHNPLIGRPTKNDLKELVIGHGAHGYIALYRYVPEIDTVFLLAIRSQHEAGYSRL